MWRRLMLALVVAFLTASVPVSADAADGGENVQTGTFTFTSPTCVPFADVGFIVCGAAGTINYHLVFTPSGNENSWFKVTDFTGTVFTGVLTGTVFGICPPSPACPSMTFASESAMVLVHLRPGGTGFILVNHPSPAPLPHEVPVP